MVNEEWIHFHFHFRDETSDRLDLFYPTIACCAFLFSISIQTSFTILSHPIIDHIASYQISSYRMHYATKYTFETRLRTARAFHSTPIFPITRLQEEGFKFPLQLNFQRYINLPILYIILYTSNFTNETTVVTSRTCSLI